MEDKVGELVLNSNSKEDNLINPKDNESDSTVNDVQNENQDNSEFEKLHVEVCRVNSSSIFNCNLISL